MIRKFQSLFFPLTSETIQTIAKNKTINEPPRIIALLKMPAVALDEMPKNIRNAANVNAIKDNAFINVNSKTN